MAQAEGYANGTWATYRKWRERGAQVRQGERVCPVVFWKALDGRDDEDEAGDEADRQAQAAADWMHARRAPADAAA